MSINHRIPQIVDGIDDALCPSCGWCSACLNHDEAGEAAILR
jgi:hypothetical protein